MYKVWFTGSHGTGKTTQVEYFRKFYPEYTKVDMERRNLFAAGIIKPNKDASPWDEIVIAGNAMLAMISTASPFISDRSWVDKCAYTQCSPFPEELLEAFHIVNVSSFFGVSEIDRYFYFPPMIDLEDDGVRSPDPAYQKEVDYWIQFYLDYFKIPYHTIESYTIQDRHMEIIKTLFGKI